MFGRNGKRGPAGHIIVTAPDSQPVELETRQCRHCGKHWLYQPGSGKRRGFCLKCMGLTCGEPECDPCVPYEARIELSEGAKPGQPARKYAQEHGKTIVVGG